MRDRSRVPCQVRGTDWSTRVDISGRHISTLVTDVGPAWPRGLMGEVRLVVKRKKTPALTGPGRQEHGHFVWGDAPQCLRQQLNMDGPRPARAWESRDWH